ncbi:MAG: methylated-DNA--[protein]-cysteine S-methyltransferase [bacterium]
MSEKQIIDYQRIEQAIRFIEEEYQRKPDLKEIADHVHLSEFHFQRLFKRWAGITPKQFMQFLTIQHAKEILAESNSVLDAAYETGLSSTGRLHDLFVSVDAVTPGEYKSAGSGLTVQFGFHATPFGQCLLATTERGISNLYFVSDEKKREMVDILKSYWKQADVKENTVLTKRYADSIFSPSGNKTHRPLKLFLMGTNFQIKVWEALLRIPQGSIVTYEDVARSIGKPSASRAVGNAVGANPISYIVPCHRVIRQSGIIGNYRWGHFRKRAMLAWEFAKRP